MVTVSHAVSDVAIPLLYRRPVLHLTVCPRAWTRGQNKDRQTVWQLSQQPRHRAPGFFAALSATPAHLHSMRSLHLQIDSACDECADAWFRALPSLARSLGNLRSVTLEWLWNAPSDPWVVLGSTVGLPQLRTVDLRLGPSPALPTPRPFLSVRQVRVQTGAMKKEIIDCLATAFPLAEDLYLQIRVGYELVTPTVIDNLSTMTRLRAFCIEAPTWDDALLGGIGARLPPSVDRFAVSVDRRYCGDLLEVSFERVLPRMTALRLLEPLIAYVEVLTTAVGAGRYPDLRLLEMEPRGPPLTAAEQQGVWTREPLQNLNTAFRDAGFENVSTEVAIRYRAVESGTSSLLG